MHRINHHIRMVLVSILMAALAVCIFTNPSLSQPKRRDKADKKTRPVSARDNSVSPPATAPARTLAPWALVGQTKPPDEKARLKSVKYEIYLRAGLVAYLSQDYDKAVAMFEAAGPMKPPTKFTALSGKGDLYRMGLHYMIKAAAKKKSLTDEKALAAAKNDRQRVAIQLADLYIHAIRPDKAEEIFVRIAERDPVFRPTNPGIEGYAILRLAVALDRQRGKRPQALVWLKKLCGPRYKDTYWGPYGMFRLALFTYNQKQDPKEVMPLYKKMFTRYPDHPMAELALAYYCLNAARIKDKKLTEKACKAFLKKYPDSELKNLITRTLKEST